MLLFPGRKPVEADKLGPAGHQAVRGPAGAGRQAEAAVPARGLRGVRRRDLGGQGAGRAAGAAGRGLLGPRPLPGRAQRRRARPRRAQMASLPKRIVVPPNETTRQEVLDAEFERSFVAEGLRRLRFSSSQERRQLEESYARRLAERFDADAVVLASVGELSGADWLNARLYLRSGYLNRQGLVRLEAQRANALGRFLATGKDVPGVLQARGGRRAGGRLPPGRQREPPEWTPGTPTSPAGRSWAAAWSPWASAAGSTRGAEDKQDQADDLRGDSERQSALYREAQSEKFWGGVAHRGRPAGLAPPAWCCCWSPNTTHRRRDVHLQPEPPPGRRRAGRRRPVLAGLVAPKLRKVLPSRWLSNSSLAQLALRLTDMTRTSSRMPSKPRRAHRSAQRLIADPERVVRVFAARRGAGGAPPVDEHRQIVRPVGPVLAHDHVAHPDLVWAGRW